MPTPLVIIEAPGKVATLTTLLEDTALAGARVFATQGRLLDLDPDGPGVDAVTFAPLYTHPLHPRRIEQLRQILASTSRVWLATDNDSEGELIAAHAIQIIREVRPDLPCERLRVPHLTRAAWVAALKAAGPLQEDKVRVATSRRALDRLLGFGFGARGDNPRLSRIQIPALAHLSRPDAPAAWQLFHEAPAPDGMGAAWLSLGFAAGQEVEAQALFGQLGQLPPPQLVLVKETAGQEQPPLLTGPEALLLIAEATDQPVALVDTHLQRLYEQGKVSYPRTDSTHLSPERERALQQMAQFYGVPRRKDGLQLAAQREPGLEGAHEALTPLNEGPDRAAPLHSLGPQDQCLAVLRDLTLRAAGGHIETRTREYRLDMNAPANQAWTRALPAQAPHFRWRVVLRQQSHYRLPPEKPMDRLGRRLHSRQLGRAWLRRVPDDQRTLETLIQLGLGRPSTAAFHARRLAEDALEANGLLKASQIQRLSEAEAISPHLLDASAAVAAEDRLYQSGSLTERITEAAAAIGISRAQLEAACRPLPAPPFPRPGFTPGRELPMDS